MSFRGIASLSVATLVFAIIANAQVVSSIGAQKRPAVIQRSDGGFWRVDQGFKSQMVLTNVLITSPLSVTPVLYMADGTRYELKAIMLQPSGVARIDISDALSNAPPAIRSHLSEFGNASIEYVWRWQAIVATVNSVDVARSLVFTSRLSGEKPRAATTQGAAPATNRVVDEGMWWRHDPDVGGFLALMNTTAKEIAVDVNIFASNGPARSGVENSVAALDRGGIERVVRIAPRTTEFVDLGPALFRFPQSSIAGGITASYAGYPSDVRVSGGLESPAIGYSARIPFIVRPEKPDPEMFMSAAVGLMVGTPDPKMMFPAGTTFLPYGVVRNLGSKPALVTPAINYEANGQTITVQLPSFSLGPNQAEALDLRRELQRLGLGSFSGMVNLVVSSTAHFGDMLFTAGSVDKSGTYVLEAGCNALRRTSKVMFGEWDVSNGEDTMISLWNPTNSDQDLILHLYYGNGEYKYPIHLPKGRSRMFNVSEVIAAQVPDSDGNVVPASAQSGSAAISGAGTGTGAGSGTIEVGVSYGIFNVKNATCRNLCGHCNVYTDFFISPSSFTILVGDKVTMTDEAEFQDGSSRDETVNTVWSSTNSTVGDNSGNVFTAKAPGNFFVEGYAPLQDGNCDDQEKYCTSTPQFATSAYGTVIPSCPSSVVVGPVTQLSLARIFPNYKTGVGIDVSMQASPSTTNSDGAQVTELVTTFSNSCPSGFGNLCQGSSVFTFGEGPVTTFDGQTLPAIHNAFYDEHVIASSASLLDFYHVSSCQAVCTQTYSCGGATLGTFTITYSFAKGTLQGSPVTNVTATKH